MVTIWSQVARRAHNPKIAGLNPIIAPILYRSVPFQLNSDHS